MRSRRLVPVLVLGLLVSACGSTVADRTAPSTPPAPPAPRTTPADPALLLASYQGTVSVRTSNGTVAFRAPNGLAAPDRSVIAQAEPMAAGTRVAVSDPLSGAVRWQQDVAGSRRVRVVSPGGHYVALVDASLATASLPRSSTVVDVVTATHARAYRFAGNLDPEAFSADGTWLYVIDFLPATAPDRYSVRRVDLATGHIQAVPDRDGSVRAPMPGYAQAQVMSPDGTRLYTFYASAEPITGDDGDQYHAWIHVLDLAHGWAHCLELDEDIAKAGGANAALALNADGSRLYVSDRLSHALVAIDTATLRPTRTRFDADLTNPDGPALLAATGSTLFLNEDHGLVRVAAATLKPEGRVVDAGEQFRALRADHAGRVLFGLASTGVLVLDARGRRLALWGLPGDAYDIAPSTAPGRGSYQCAC
jgi:DNA-binding beta-propeller fold protein YncE